MNGTQARSNPLPGILTVAGGAIAIIGCLLPWGKVSAGQSGLFPSQTGSGLESPFDLGWLALVAGIGLGVAGITLLLVPISQSVWRLVSLAAIVAALIPILVGAYNAASKEDKVNDAIRDGIEESTGQKLTDAQLEVVKVELERIGIEVTLQFGIYITILGGLVGIVGGVLAMRAKDTQPAGGVSGFEPSAPVQAPPPPPQPGEAWQPPPPEAPSGQGPEQDRGP